MFINHTKKFIFLSVTKTGSTSVKSVLVKNCQNDDIAYTRSNFDEDYYDAYNIPENEFSTHLNLSEALELNILTKKQIQEYRIFGILRNPVDRFISQISFLMFYGRENNLFDQNKIIQEWYRIKHEFDGSIIEKEIMKPQIYWLKHKGIPINNLVQYENIENIIYYMIGKKIELPSYRSDIRNEKQKNYKCVYDYLRNRIIDEYVEDHSLYLRLQSIKL